MQFLENLPEDTNEKTNEDGKIIIDTPKIPPVFVSGIADINIFRSMLNKAAKDEFTLKIKNKTQIKIISTKVDSYRAVIQELNNNEIKYHTYQLKQDLKLRLPSCHQKYSLLYRPN